MSRAQKPSRLLTVHEQVALQEGELRLVVVADTHSKPHPRANELIMKERPHRILHAGDIGDFSVLDQFATIAPLSAVRGNIDGQGDDIPDVRILDVRDGETSLWKLLLLHIAVNGPKLRADAVRLATAEDASVVVCGHSHVPFLGRDRGLVMFNPGSIGPRRFQLPILFGVIHIQRDRVEMRHIDCESGNVWRP
ncbi:metallophosphatase family protein [Pendulispora rubella]|uniref:Phosphoesterase n=1 Tax=Pendulispora rubella TaxID=2741070 RepID=A0ABZ2LJ46_9BACT